MRDCNVPGHVMGHSKGRREGAQRAVEKLGAVAFWIACSPAVPVLMAVQGGYRSGQHARCFNA